MHTLPSENKAIECDHTSADIQTAKVSKQLLHCELIGISVMSTSSHNPTAQMLNNRHSGITVLFS